MVHVLGVALPDLQLARLALTNFYGIGHKTAQRLCARLQIHDRCKIRDLTAQQITELASFLASPSTVPPLRRMPLASPTFQPPPASTPIEILRKRVTELSKPTGAEPLRNLKIEAEGRRVVRENIAHQRMIGSYVGKRHAMGLPVRGQNTQSNAKTAKKLNRVNRFG
ncbi:mitochondrial 30S ribosomal protein S13 [Pisolithus albus]|nr:mitochondrial 30S ribosomal protein S13 [Pisolithus albus]KAI6118838.1 mitochondrial 30S ribosomal protein S13 [Pisolithus croceorrhizus]